MAENKTTFTEASVNEFVANVEHPVRQSDAKVLIAMLGEVTGEVPVMFGPTIVGFGTHHYRHESGREGVTPTIAFSPRKASLTLYGFMSAPGSDELLARLGKHKLSKGCVYVNKLADVDQGVLRELADINYRYFLTTDKSMVPR